MELLFWTLQPNSSEALGHPFPELESLKIEYCGSYPIFGRPVDAWTEFPATLLSGSAPSLRRLTLQDVKLERLIPLLSSATGLEELALTVWTTDGTHPEALLIANLQRMSCLRRLKLKLESYDWVIAASPNPSPPKSVEDVVSLSKLTDFIFSGYGSYLQILVTGLAAPSLQRLDAKYYSDATSPLPQLCKFICNSRRQFKTLRLDLSNWNVKFSAETCSKFNHAQPAFMIAIPKPIPWENIGQMLSGQLSTVEELVIGSSFPGFVQTPHNIPWHALFNRIPQVRIVQVHYTAALAVALAFRVQPDGQGPALDLLPSLEQVEVQFPLEILGSARDNLYLPIRDAFEPLIAARQQVGHIIVVNLSQGSESFGDHLLHGHVDF
jgi:hypothetical protein